jgi:5-methylcytosine-specific restriction endonuclease McrA
MPNIKPPKMYKYGEPKTCTRCGRTYPTTEKFFHRDKSQRCGWACWCKKCKNAARDRWTIENEQHIKEYKRQWRNENHAHIIAQKCQRRRETGCHIIYKFNREARINHSGEFFTFEWNALLSYYASDGLCLCCAQKRELTVDHVIPISMGGPNTIDNLQPLCQSCNSAKCTRIIDYRPDRGKYAKSLAQKTPFQPTLPIFGRKPYQLPLPLFKSVSDS